MEHTVSMGRPRKGAFDEDTTVRVLKAAEEVFAARGFAGARLEDIAAIASIKRSSLLYHFGSKDNLYQKVVEHAFTEIALATSRGLQAEGAFEERMFAIVDELLNFERMHRDLMSVVFRALTDPQATGHEDIRRRFGVVLDELERFLDDEGTGVVPEGLPVRAALMQLIVAQLARAAIGDSGEELWRGDAATRELAGWLLLRHPPNETT